MDADVRPVVPVPVRIVIATLVLAGDLGDGVLGAVEVEIEVLQWEDMDLERVEILAASRAEYVATVEGNPGLIAMVGPAYAVTSVGGDVAWQWGAFGAVVAAVIGSYPLGLLTPARVGDYAGRALYLRDVPLP